MISDSECTKNWGKSEKFDCISGEEYYQAVDDFQQNVNVEILEYNSEKICQIILDQKGSDQRLCNRIVKLYDIIANFQNGSEDVSKYVKQTIRAIVLVLEKSKSEYSDFFISVLSSAFINYHKQYQDLLNEEFFDVCKNQKLAIPLAKMTSLACDAFFKSCLKYCQNGEQVEEILIQTSLSDKIVQDLAKRLLFRLSALENWTMYSNFATFVSLRFDEEIVKNLLKQTMSLWSDPIIAKAYVYKEVIHYTKLCLVLFANLSPKVALSMQDDIMKFVAQGLPNHFSSTDHRSIQLAKFFCEILTESLKLYEKRNEEIPQTLRQPEDEINQQLLKSVPNCKKSKHFWQNFKLEKLNLKVILAAKDISKFKVEKEVIEENDDDDDDDDLEAIETLEPPIKCSVPYIRDFIETLSEDKPYEERLAIFSSLPTVVKHQIKHEHPQIGLGLINMLVRWENDFESTEMDMLRKRSLCNVLSSKMEGNVQHLCSIFPKESTRVPQQFLIVDVLTRAASESNLADLQILSKAAFDHMLQIDLFETREVPLRIPVILFFHRLLSTMPSQMIRSEMVENYIKALTYMTKVDKATEQTISYSLHNLVDKLRDVQFANEESKNNDLSQRLAEMRSWMANLQINSS